MPQRLRLIVLSIAFLAVVVVVYPRIAASRLPGDHSGYAPVQPIAYSHRLHAGELSIPCLYCHFGAEKSRHAGIPPANSCMNCHKTVTATMGAVRAEEELAAAQQRPVQLPVSPELQKLYDALGLNEKLEPDPARTPQPIHWVQVHRLPDFAYFDHRAHVTAGVTCQTCHGPVETMERMRQWSNLSMGWCVNCHREARNNGIKGKPANPSLDCAACHY